MNHLINKIKLFCLSPFDFYLTIFKKTDIFELYKYTASSTIKYIRAVLWTIIHT